VISLNLHFISYLDPARPRAFTGRLKPGDENSTGSDEIDEQLLSREAARLWDTDLFGTEHAVIRLWMITRTGGNGDEMVLFRAPDSPEPGAFTRGAAPEYPYAELDALMMLMEHLAAGLIQDSAGSGIASLAAGPQLLLPCLHQQGNFLQVLASAC
jgi:hypothetical protein